MLERYSHYGWNKRDICRKWGLSVQTFYNSKKKTPKADMPRRAQLNAITATEKRAVILYALSHTELNHREMAYKMIDEDIAFMSPSSVYRILSENNLLVKRNNGKKFEKCTPHDPLTRPDQVWQTDLMVIFYMNREYYFLSYMDVFSRYIVYHQLLFSMTGMTVREITQQAIIKIGKRPDIIQSDNGSCYISSEYRNFLSKTGITHRRIHPHCPNENAEIERYHRTVRELMDPDDASDFEHLTKLLDEKIHYYNFDRYHSAIGFVTPWARYCGKAEKILRSREQKLERAKNKRIKENMKKFKEKDQKINSVAA